jgi:hypothetical protein
MLWQALSYLHGRKSVEDRLDAIAAMPSAKVGQQFGRRAEQRSQECSGRDDEPEGLRSEKRHRVLISARLVDARTLDAVRVRDISNKGARVFGVANCECGVGVVLGKGEVLIPAQVVWKQNGEAGLRFDRELSAGELDDLIPGLGSLGVDRRDECSEGGSV